MWEFLDLIQKSIQYFALMCLVGPAIATYVFRSQVTVRLPTQYGVIFGFLTIVVVALSPMQFAYRLGGISDTSLYRLALYGSVGASLALKLFGIILLLLSIKAENSKKLFLQSLGSIILIVGFVFVGHVAAESRWQSILLAGHLILACWWFGGLMYLRAAIDTTLPGQFHTLLVYFSQHAIRVVALLVILGIILSITLLGVEPTEWNRHYLAYFIGKLTLVSILLGFACYNKVVLTRDLALATSPKRVSTITKRLKGSIEMELVLFVTLIVVTAAVTSLTSPTL